MLSWCDSFLAVPEAGGPLADISPKLLSEAKNDCKQRDPIITWLGW